MTADEYYRLGNEYRRRGDWKHAIDNYLEAIELDPQSPAVEAKQMIDDILNFYCKDIYNP
ncbi:tetratricopeptide repeat protein [Prevotella sp. HCN-7019]|uniref:tetratricopeptide repeat protein n=1 Tax=Prevotella sp. HCN-7019 TaxID=3134668 RepID=UPI00262B50B7